ncbi:MAG: transposase [Thermodesulfobacteriota bacterium]
MPRNWLTLCKLYHWVLMSNHVHLVVETAEESPISKIMQGMNLAYAIWFNRKTGKVGHLWQGSLNGYPCLFT